jgi:hypothetical protein
MPGKKKQNKKQTTKRKVQLEPLQPIVSEIDKVLGDLRAQLKTASPEQKKTLNLRMTVLKRCRGDLFEFWGC